MKMINANTNGNLQWELFREAHVKTAREVIPEKSSRIRRRKVTTNG